MITAKAFFLTLGLLSIFIVIGASGIKLLCAAVILYVAARTIIAFARA